MRAVPADKRDLRIYMMPAELYGPGNYRIISPFRALRAAGVDAHLIATLDARYLDEADVFVMQRLATQDTLSYWAEAKKRGAAVIFDMDDMLTKIPSDHADYRFFSEFKQSVEQALKEADVVTTPSEFLLQELQEYSSNVVLVPNYIDLDLWKRDATGREDARAIWELPSEAIVLGWMGGHTHKEDLELVREAVNKITAVNEATYLALIGFDPGFFEIPDDRKRYVEFGRFGSYISALSAIDIALAPLKDNYFSKCKSSVKVLEYGMAGVATISSDVGPYSAIKADGAPIILASDSAAWERALTELVDDGPQRGRLGDGLRDFVEANYILQNNISMFADVYEAAARQR